MNIYELKTFYINLDSRPDRKQHVIKELDKIGITNAERFKAIYLDNGAIGCSMSHLKCLENAKKNNYEYILIVEDDIEFLYPKIFIEQFNKFINSHIEWDVILIAGNNMLPYEPVDEYCIRVFNCQTTTGYIVKKEYYDTLINNYKKGIKLLIENPSNNSYKIDKYWFQLQMKDKWYLIIPPSVVQKEDYSDIEKCVTNFQSYMLNYNKCYKK
jgi:glycosyl transferase family 25